MAEPRTPEGRLLKARLTASGQSARKAAEAVDLSDTRLRHIINGVQPAGRGQQLEVTAPAATLARIAHHLGITVDELRATGRTDAATILASLPGASDHGRTVGGDPQDAEHGDASLLYRRPEGLSDQEWERVKRESREFIEWQIEKASRER